MQSFDSERVNCVSKNIRPCIPPAEITMNSCPPKSHGNFHFFTDYAHRKYAIFQLTSKQWHVSLQSCSEFRIKNCRWLMPPFSTHARHIHNLINLPAPVCASCWFSPPCSSGRDGRRRWPAPGGASAGRWGDERAAREQNHNQGDLCIILLYLLGCYL